jgi:hypothetical protein
MQSTPSHAEMEAFRHEKEAEIRQCLRDIVSSSDAELVIHGFDILHKLLGNILKHPTEEKFRMLKKSNKTIQVKLLGLKPQQRVLDLLHALGYVDIDDEICAFTGNYFNVLNAGAVMVEEESMQLKMQFMNQEDRTKQEIVQKNKKDMIAKMRADAEYKKNLEHLSM